MAQRILFVRANPYEENLNSYNVQGVGIAKAFCKLGYDCDYLTFTYHPDEVIDVFEREGCKARVIYKKWKRILRTGYSSDALKKSFLDQYDFIIAREYNQIMTYLLSKTGKKTAMYSGPYWNMFLIPWVSVLYDLFIVKKINRNIPYKFVKSELAKDFLERKGMTDLINIGVGLDTDNFILVDPSEQTKDVMEYMTSYPCILYIGELNDNKNLPLILDVFSRLSIKRSELRLVLVGKSRQTFLKKLLGAKDESYVQKIFASLPKEIKNKIKWEEQIDNSQLQHIYPLAKVFMLPSKKEIFGMVMLEAMFFGAPVITSYNGGSSTLIKPNETGQIIDSFDPDKWVAGIEKYLDDADYAEIIKRNARQLIQTQYTWESIAKKILSAMGLSY